MPTTQAGSPDPGNSPTNLLSKPLSTQPLFPAIKVLSVDPVLGVAGSHVKVVINVHPSSSSPIRSFRVVFGSLDANTRVAFENRASAVEHVELMATAPQLDGPHQTGRVSLLVLALDIHDNQLANAAAGAFEYIDGKLSLLFMAIAVLTVYLFYTAASFGYSPQAHQRTLSANVRKRYGDPLQSDRPAPGRLSKLDFFGCPSTGLKWFARS